MELRIEGKIIQKLDIESGTSARGEWKRQNFIIETVEQYPRKVCIGLWTAQIPILEQFQVGEMISAAINIESREFQGKWYTDVRAWRLDHPQQVQPQMQQGMPQMQQGMPYGTPQGYPQQQYPQQQYQPQYQQPQQGMPQMQQGMPYGAPQGYPQQQYPQQQYQPQTTQLPPQDYMEPQQPAGSDDLPF